jgi:hypothetical protein
MIDNRVVDQHPCVITVTPAPFKDPMRIATKIIKDDKEFSYKMEMPPCGTGSESMIRHVHEFSSGIENLEISPENERARFALFRCSLTTNGSSSAKTGWDEVHNGGTITPLTKNLFIQLGKQWIARSAVERDRADQVLRSRTVAKLNLLLCNQLADWLPGPTPVLTADELKQTFFNAMPHLWTILSHANHEHTSATNNKSISTSSSHCHQTTTLIFLTKSTSHKSWKPSIKKWTSMNR